MNKFLAFAAFALSLTVCAADPKSVKVLFDTDLLTDYDDVGALACLHALADAGECEILATVACARGAANVAWCQILNDYYGRPDLPVGCTKGIGVVERGSGVYWDKRVRRDFVRRFNRAWSDSSNAPDALEVYRKTLAAQSDGSVVLCTVGFLTNVRKLIESGPDRFSPFSGEELMRRKVVRWVAMAGWAPEGREYNVRKDVASAKIAIARSPVPIVFSDCTYGGAVKSGIPLALSPETAIPNPVRTIYRAFMKDVKPGDRGHASFDQTAVLAAVRGAPSELFALEHGTFEVDAKTGATKWVSDPKHVNGRLRTVRPNGTFEKVGALVDELLMRKPTRTGPDKLTTLEREIALDGDYLRVPVTADAPQTFLELVVDGRRVRWCDCTLACGRPVDFYGSIDVKAWKGKKALIRFRNVRRPVKSEDGVTCADAVWYPQDLRQEPLRSQLRFSPPLGWMNDPNGLSYRDGEWHLFYQTCPLMICWGTMHWGHAVSKDLLQWTDLPVALYPDNLGQMFSGGAVSDPENRAGFGANAHVLVYLGAESRRVGLAPSADGRTYGKWPDEFAAKDVVDGGDPYVFFHRPTDRWVMLVNQCRGGKRDIVFFSSANLKDWQEESIYRGGDGKIDQWLHECPGLVEAKIEGEDGTAWICWGGDERYAVGSFDGHRFLPEVERVDGIQFHRGVKGGAHASYYAGQAFADVPDGRVLYLPWFRCATRDSRRFNQQMGLPEELSLKRTAEGLRLVRRPARECEGLRAGAAVSPEAFAGELAEVWLSAEVGADGRVELDARGVPVVWEKGLLKVGTGEMDWPLADGRLGLRLYVDRRGFEIFSQDGLLSGPAHWATPDPANRRLSVRTSGDVKNLKVDVYPLKSVWQDSSSGREIW